MNCSGQEKTVILRLKQEREKQKLSQLELAFKSNVSQNMIAYIETGKRTPTLSTLIKLCNALNINPSVLFAEEDEQRESIKNDIIALVGKL